MEEQTTKYLAQISDRIEHQNQLLGRLTIALEQIALAYGGDVPQSLPDKFQPKPETLSNTQPKTEPEAQPKTKPETLSNAKPKTLSSSEPEAQPKTKPETLSNAKPETLSKVEPEAQPEAQSEAQSKVQVEPQAEDKPLYPEHNATVKSIRLRLGYHAQEIVKWCKSYSQDETCDQPAKLPPEGFEKLIEVLCVSWGKRGFDSEELCRNSYQGKVGVLKASGQTLEQSANSWIDSVIETKRNNPVEPQR